MKKKEGWCFERLVILAMVAVLMVSFVAVTAYAKDGGELRSTIGPKSMQKATPATDTEPIHNPAGSQMFIAWLTIPVTCDGYIDASEWADASMYDISDTTGQEDGIADPLGTVYLWLKQDDNGIYFAIRNNADATLDDYDQCGLYFDDDYDGCFPASATTEGNNWLVYEATGNWVQWRWIQDFDCGFPPNYVCAGDNYGGYYNWSPPCFGIGIGPTGVVDYEVMIPYGTLDEYLDLTMPPDSLGFYIYCLNYLPYVFNGEWPSQTNSDTYKEPCYFGRLICSGQDPLYWKPGYPNYAPNGMPDIDMFQGYGWFKTETGKPTFDGPCALANCFKWFDSKYEDPLGFPGDGFDNFPLVRDYLDGLPAFTGIMDDHDPANVDIDWWLGSVTPWQQGATTPPPPTTQPFIPGYQYPPQPMPAWGELVERIAWYVDLDGVQSGYCNHSGTRPQDMYQGIQDWLNSETFEDGSTLADTLCVNIWPMPTFELVEGLVEKCEDVILLLGFWFGEEETEQLFIRGDYYEDGIIDVNDYIYCISVIPTNCYDAMDVNDDGIVDFSADCSYLINYLGGGPPPPAPFPNCGVDRTPDALDCASYPYCPPGIGWHRVGGHWVTVAGINSDSLLIGFSDPFIDNAEWGGRGRVLSGTVIPHNHEIFDHFTHNDEGNVSHDIYQVNNDPITPGGLWEIVDYGDPYASPSFITSRFEFANIPPEFETMTMPYDTLYPLVTEVEYAIQISPWDYRGDVNVPGGDGQVSVDDVSFLIAYLYRSGPAPWSFVEGDANCDGEVEVGDIVVLINYLFRYGPVPRCCDP